MITLDENQWWKENTAVQIYPKMVHVHELGADKDEYYLLWFLNHWARIGFVNNSFELGRGVIVPDERLKEWERIRDDFCKMQQEIKDIFYKSRNESPPPNVGF